MPSAKDLSPDNRFVGLFVGRSGSGKTVAAASFPKPLHINDFDGRIRGLLGAPWIDRTQITYDYFPPKADGLIKKLNDNLTVLEIMGRKGSLETQTHITDSITNECYAFICQSIPLTHTEGKGKMIGPISMAGPEDYGLESQAMSDYMAFLKSLPIRNIILSAHIIDRYGKANPADKYSESVVIGQKLSIRDKIGENIQTHFDHIFEFEREMYGDQERYFVTFRGQLARTSYVGLPNGRIEITGKNFYEELMRLTGGGKQDVAS